MLTQGGSHLAPAVDAPRRDDPRLPAAAPAFRAWLVHHAGNDHPTTGHRPAKGDARPGSSQIDPRRIGAIYSEG